MAANDPTSPTKQVIEDYKNIELTPKMNAVKAELEAAKTKTDSSASNRQYKICAYVEGQELLNFYNTLDFCEAISAVSASGQVGDKIKKIEAKNGELKKQFDDVVKSIKDLRTKLYEVEMKAYDVGDAFEDPANKDQIMVLRDFLQKPTVENLVDMSDKTHDKSNRAFSTAVDVAGILTFANIESLKGFGDALSQKTVDFKKNVDDNVKKAADDLKKAQQELGEASKALMVNKLVGKDYSVEDEGLAATDEFLGNGDNAICDCLPTIEKVCQDLEDSYNKNDPPKSSVALTKYEKPSRKGGYRD